MKKNFRKTISLTLALALVLVYTFTVFPTTASTAGASLVDYTAHVSTIGWQSSVSDGRTAGTTGRSLQIEALRIRLNVPGGIRIRTHIATLGWVNYTSAQAGSWAESGTTGKGLAMEAVQIELTGAAASSYDVLYRVHSQNIGWGNWVKNGEVAGTTGQALRAEAIEIKLQPKSGAVYYVKTNGGNLNVRSGPGTSYSSLGQLSNGTQVTVYSISNGWARINYSNKTGYVSSAYLSTGSSGWQYPVSNSYVCGNDWSQYYAARASAGRPDHAGIDIKSSTGNTAIYAAADGTIVASGYNSSNGNFVIIQHTVSGKTVYSFYAHLSKITKSSGWVAKGTQIGVIGNTGSSSAGIHLHFAIADTLSKTGGYYGYVSSFTGDKVTYGGVTFYNPHYVVAHGTLPN